MTNTPHDAQQWRKSRLSNPSGNCTELRRLPDGNVEMRNSRFPDDPSLIFTPDEILAFFGGVKDSEFDYLIKD